MVYLYPIIVSLHLFGTHYIPSTEIFHIFLPYLIYSSSFSCNRIYIYIYIYTRICHWYNHKYHIIFILPPSTYAFYRTYSWWSSPIKKDIYLMVTRLMLSCILVVSIRPLLSLVLPYTLHLCDFLYFFSISTYLYISKQKKLRIFGLVNNIWFSNMCISSIVNSSHSSSYLY